MIDRGYPPDVSVQELPASHRSKPPSGQARGKECYQSQLKRSDAENVHGDCAKYPQENVSNVENGHTLISRFQSDVGPIVFFLSQFIICSARQVCDNWMFQYNCPASSLREDPPQVVRIKELVMRDPSLQRHDEA